MAGIKLPIANIPDWAQNVPEDSWKEHLLNRLSTPPASSQRQSNNKSKGGSKKNESANHKDLSNDTSADDNDKGT